MLTEEVDSNEQEEMFEENLIEINSDSIPDEDRRAGRAQELQQMKDFEVYEEIDANSWKGKVINATWVEVPKPGRTPPVRCRLVAKQFRFFDGWRDDVLAGTPDLVVYRVLLARAAANPDMGILIADVTAAFLQAPLDETEVLVVKPPEDANTPNTLWRLKKAMYGTRKASKHWDTKKAEVMKTLGFTRLKGDSSVYFHESLDILTEIHGDDWLAVGPPKNLRILGNGLKQHLTVTLKDIIAVGPGFAKQGVFLKRELRLTDNGYEYEANRTHVNDLLDTLGLQNCKPGYRPGGGETQDKRCTGHESISTIGHQGIRYHACICRRQHRPLSVGCGG